MIGNQGPGPSPERKPKPGWIGAHALLVSLLGAWAFTSLTPPPPLGADGGTLRVANVPMGAYRVNVFTDPTPITPDSIDVSVLATFERGRGAAVGLGIMVEGRRLDAKGSVVRHPATREEATDPRYYSAKFALGEVGDWEIRVVVRGPEGEGEVTFQVRVQEPGPFDSPFTILLLALLPLLLMGWWLRKTNGPPAESNPPAAHR